MSDRRVFRLATTSTRMLAGTVVSAAAVIAVVTAISLPWPAVSHRPVEVSALPAPTDSVLVCDGSLLAVGADPTDAAGLSVAAPQQVLGGVMDDAPAAEESTLATQGIDDEGPAVFVAPPADRRRTDAGASGSASVDGDDLAGFAASACRPPMLESWLVGGSAATGAADLVLVSNPGDVAATVQLTVFGANGSTTPPGGADAVVPAGAQRIFPLAGLVLGEESPVVRVSSVGAPVRASLQTSMTRTLTPIGVDQVSAIPQPETDQSVIGVTVTSEPGETGASEGSTVARLLSPDADTTAVVTVREVGVSAPAADPQSVPLTAGVPVEVDLAGLPLGSYTVDVAAESPVVTAVRQSTGFDEGDDFAWYAAAPSISAPSMFAAPAGAPPVLTIENTTDEDAVVSVESSDGAYRLELAIPAGESTQARISARAVYRIDPGPNTVRAALSISGDGALAGFPVWPSDAAAGAITVYP